MYSRVLDPLLPSSYYETVSAGFIVGEHLGQLVIVSWARPRFLSNLDPARKTRPGNDSIRWWREGRESLVTHEVGPTDSLMRLHSLMIWSQLASPRPLVAATAREERENKGYLFITGLIIKVWGKQGHADTYTVYILSQRVHPGPLALVWLYYLRCDRDY